MKPRFSGEGRSSLTGLQFQDENFGRRDRVWTRRPNGDTSPPFVLIEDDKLPLKRPFPPNHLACAGGLKPELEPVLSSWSRSRCISGRGKSRHPTDWSGNDASRYYQKGCPGTRFRIHLGRPRRRFFHHTSLVGTSFDSLQEGQVVEYELESDVDARRSPGKGPRASSVRLT
jgi:cold shock CspA family protein